MIDNKISWADVKVIHDGYELSRMEKIKLITKYPEYLPYLRVCYSSISNYNCGHCEKCLRTITALVLLGTDPKNCNFNPNKKIFFYLKDCLIKSKLYMGEDERFMWTDIQKIIPEQIDKDSYESKEFFMWFKKFDMSKYRAKKLYHLLWAIAYFIRERKIKKTIHLIKSYLRRPYLVWRKG